MLSPTRELAFQLADQVVALGAGASVRVETVVGGLDAHAHARAGVRTRTRTRTHARTRARKRARTRTHTRTHARTRVRVLWPRPML